MDTTPPDVYGCPADIRRTTTDIGSQQVAVTWTEPWASDKSGKVVLFHQTHQSGEEFDIGSTPVSYTFADQSDNVAACNFIIIVDERKLMIVAYQNWLRKCCLLKNSLWNLDIFVKNSIHRPWKLHEREKSESVRIRTEKMPANIDVILKNDVSNYVTTWQCSQSIYM